jgi:hypothetical protein
MRKRMPLIKKRVPNDVGTAAKRLKDAIASHIAGISGPEEITEIDVVASEVHSHPEERSVWEAAVLAVVNHIAPEMSTWWRPIELFLALTELAPSGLAERLEGILTSTQPHEPFSRASIYSMLAALGKPPTAKALFADKDLRQKAPLLWIDLVLPALLDLGERQELLLAEIQAGHFAVEHFAYRLNDMRSLAACRTWV